MSERVWFSEKDRWIQRQESEVETRLIDFSELKTLRNTEAIYPAIQIVWVSSEGFSFPNFCANAFDVSSQNVSPTFLDS